MVGAISVCVHQPTSAMQICGFLSGELGVSVRPLCCEVVRFAQYPGQFQRVGAGCLNSEVSKSAMIQMKWIRDGRDSRKDRNVGMRGRLRFIGKGEDFAS